MSEITDVLDRAGAAHAALSPLRLAILRQLDEPASATELAGLLNETRQKVNYHLGVLERHGLVELAEERQRRGFVERRFRRRSLVLAPDLIEPQAGLGERDAASADAVVAAATDAIRAIADASRSRSRAVTATLAADVTFATPADLEGFLAAVGDAVARFDAGPGADGLRLRVTTLAHPIPTRRST